MLVSVKYFFNVKMLSKHLTFLLIFLFVVCVSDRWRLFGEIHEGVLGSIVLSVDNGGLICSGTFGLVSKIHLNVNQPFVILQYRLILHWLKLISKQYIRYIFVPIFYNSNFKHSWMWVVMKVWMKGYWKLCFLYSICFLGIKE